ncbi:2-keto-4-pentenoate hydratase [Pacificimonas flava]|uniref:2-keto-4-pentenoate hydratase n=1 Tax=Pacificimonas flava TaxID=1234595 RepID=M2U902_9SPHN|nr:fumarylacetoacetate hydrolase family protein [Pacificimonas flava]EMD84432.1 2-keto-4-pentenoate hydratase [Pacificimonas flava]MBB5279697.1 2-keto-4-pentenoate hydratase [Pacificimonas flava]
MESANSIARDFVEARRANAVLEQYPGPMPTTLLDGYRIQDIAMDLDGRTVRGWKVGRVPVGLVGKYGAERLAGPIFEGAIRKSEVGEIPKMPVLDGFAAVEAEIMLRIGNVAGGIFTMEDAMAAVDCARFGVEIASSPYPGINEHGPAVTVSDFGNNFGLLLGPEIADWSAPGALDGRVTLGLDGEQIGAGNAADMLDGPFGSVRFLSLLLASRGRTLRQGDWISTGALTGVHRVHAGQTVRAQFKDKSYVSCKLVENGKNGN